MAESAVIKALEKELKSAEAYMSSYQRQIESAKTAVSAAERSLRDAEENLRAQEEKFVAMKRDAVALRLGIRFFTSPPAVVDWDAILSRPRATGQPATDHWGSPLPSVGP